jgi:hypothetical protein
MPSVLKDTSAALPKALNEPSVFNLSASAEQEISKDGTVLAKCLHPCSTACLLARLDEPEPCVDASRDLGEDERLLFSRRTLTTSFTAHPIHRVARHPALTLYQTGHVHDDVPP